MVTVGRIDSGEIGTAGVVVVVAGGEAVARTAGDDGRAVDEGAAGVAGVTSVARGDDAAVAMPTSARSDEPR